MQSSPIDLVGDSGEESPPPPPTTRVTRPKLRTRRAVLDAEDEAPAARTVSAPLTNSSDGGHNQEEGEDDDDNDDDDELELQILPRSTQRKRAPALNTQRTSRRRNTAPVYMDEDTANDSDDHEAEVAAQEREDNDGDYEQAEENDDDDDEDEDDGGGDMADFVDDSVEDEEEDFNDGRRRSSRVRKPVVKPRGRADEFDFDEADFLIERKNRRQSRPAASTSTTGRKRKRPQSASGSRGRVRRPRRTQNDRDDDEGDANSPSDSDDDEFLMTDDDSVDGGSGAAADDDVDENAYIVEKILAREVHTIKEWRRLRENKTTRFLQNASIFLDDEDDENEENGEKNVSTESNSADQDVVVIVGGEPEQPKSRDEQEEERFLIKWKNLSYIHASWETEKNLLEVDRNVKGKIQRFREKEMMGLLTDRLHGDEYFNPEFRDVDRILDIQDKPGDKYTPVDEDGDSGENKLRYMLVKWKALPYDAITWEREDDIRDDAAIKEYDARVLRAARRYKVLSNSKSSKRRQERKNYQFRGYSATNRPPFKDTQTMELRDYQLTGVNWMLLNWYQHRNSMLADEMGLGKTVQTVTFVNHLAEVEHLPGPYLIVAPLSTLGHWQREFTNWTNLNAVVYHGSAEARKAIQSYEFGLTNQEYAKAFPNQKIPKPSHTNPFYRFDVLITTYEMCSVPEFSKLARVKWQLVVVDEAHRLKNRNSKLSVTIQKNFVYENILLLTGTPLQNNVEELWTLLNFLDQERFESMEDFMDDYGDLKDVAQVEKLHGELKPFLLRRMKEDVEKSLAPKEETIIEVELTVLQKQYYRAIYEQNTQFLARGMKRAHAPSLMNVLMELRKCCNHPFLIKGMEQREVSCIQAQKDLSRQDMDEQITDLLVTASGKLILLDKLLPRLKENGHRVLIFSQFKIMLDVLQDYLKLRQYRCERIDGNITGNDRQAAIDRFCNPDSSAFIMLLSTRAGGVGINLTAADTVIIYDSDWNPQNDLQAQARCHRIGQKKSVKIYRLLTAKTYELHMFHQASLKLGLDQAVLGSIREREQQTAAVGTTKRPNAQMSKDEIENLLKHGAYEMFKEDKDGEAEAASKRFSEESIDQILSRSTKIIHDPKAGASEEGGKKSLMSSFSKATFVSSDNPDAQVDLNDPDFWSKVVGLQAPEKPVEPSPLKKRRCRVKSYLPQEESGDEEKVKPLMKKRGRPRKTDTEYEEFVISSSAEDDSDEDEDDDAIDDDLIIKGKKSKVQTVTPIDVYHNYLVDKMMELGYGRWEEITTRSQILMSFSPMEVAAFCYQCLASLIRVAATSFITSKHAPLPTEDGRLVPRPPLTVEEFTTHLSDFSRRFDFVRALLADTNSMHVSQIQITSHRLPRSAASAKSEREATSKLQQIDRMYLISMFVQRSIGPITPMRSVLKLFQGFPHVHQIPEMIRRGVLLTTRDKPVSASASTGAAAQTSQAPIASVDSKDSETNSIDVATAVRDVPPSTAESASATVVENVNSAVTAQHGEDCDDASKQSDQMEATAEKPVVAAQAASKTTPVSGSSTTGVRSDHGQGQVDMKHQRAALRRLQFLPPVPGAFPVSWWVPVVDDVFFILYVHEHGWIRTRDPPSSLVHSSLYGDRAKSVPENMWPNAAALNRRLRVALTGWGNDRRMESYARGIRNEEQARAQAAQMKPRTLNPPVPPQSMAKANAKQESLRNQPLISQSPYFTQAQPHTSVSRPVDASQHQLAALNHQRQSQFGAPRPAHVEDFAFRSEQRSSIDPQIVQEAMKRRRERFSMLIYAHGIPDVRNCTTENEKREQWSLIANDPELRIGLFPMSLLIDEAADLERFCVARAVDPVVNLVDPSSPSVFGGCCGLWALNLTKCRRMLDRIRLFRILREILLVQRPKRFKQFMAKIGNKLRATTVFPVWWMPEHDSWLVRTAVHFGLDELLSRVWQVEVFAKSNPTTSFPSVSWAENVLSTIATAANNSIRTDSAAATAPAAARPSAAPQAVSTVSTQRQTNEVNITRQLLATTSISDARRRVNEIVGMRGEDPHYTRVVRQRQKHDTAELADAQLTAQARREHEQKALTAQAEISVAAKEMNTVLREVRMMKQEDPYFSAQVRSLWLEQIHKERMSHRQASPLQQASASNQDVATASEAEHVDDSTGPQLEEKVAVDSEPEQTIDVQVPPVEASPTAAESEADVEIVDAVESKPEQQVVVHAPAVETTPTAAEAAIIELDDSDDSDVPKSTTEANSSPLTEAAANPSSQEQISPVKATAVTAESEDAQASSSSDDFATPEKKRSASTSTPSSSGQKRKRLPRSWEVIVIDDSDDDDEADDAKRTTRSRRRRRGEELKRGL